MRALRNCLLLLAMTFGLAFGGLPAAPAAHPSQAAHAAEEPSVTLELSRTSIKVGRAFDATGTVTDVPEGTEVRLQRGVGGVWTTVATSTTSADGAFALTNVTAPDTGAFIYQAVAGSGTSVASGYSWLIVTAKNPRPIVSGYVQAGGPVSGSEVLIYLKGQQKPVRTTSSANGYFLVELPALPKSLLVVATGGRSPIGKFKGTMTGLVPNPTTHDSFYVNPATTLMAAYLTIHPKASRATAWAKIRALLGLEKYHNLEWALGGRPSYFDSVKFLRTARKHGGFDAYVAHLVSGIDRAGKAVSFRSAGAVLAGPAPSTLRAGGSAVAGLIGDEAAGYLGVASQGAGIINASTGLMNLIGGLVGWSVSGGPTASQMMAGIDQVQTTLQALSTQIAELIAEVQQGLSELTTLVGDVGYNQAVAGLLPAYEHVQTVQDDYTDYVSDQQILASCVPRPPVTTPPTEPVVPPGPCKYTDPVTNEDYTYKYSSVVDALANVANDHLDYINSVGVMETDLGVDYFNLAIMADNGNTPALAFLMDNYLSAHGNLFLPAASTLAQNFTAKALTHQALAYYLSMAYERSLRSDVVPGGRADDLSTGYLGAGYANLPGFDPTANPLDNPVPGTGNLAEEVTYLQGVLPVPENMVVDTDAGGLMYTGTENVPLETYLPTDPASRSSCVAVETFGDGDWACTALIGPLVQLNTAMTTFAADQGSYLAGLYTEGEPTGTFYSGLSTGWNLVTAGGLASMLPRLHNVDDLDADYYLDPGPVSYGDSDVYWVHRSDFTVCVDEVNGQSPDCLGSNEGVPVGTGIGAIDWLELFFQYRDGTERTCTWAVGQANGNTDACFDMPALIGRPLQSGEVYVP